MALLGAYLPFCLGCNIWGIPELHAKLGLCFSVGHIGCLMECDCCLLRRIGASGLCPSANQKLCSSTSQRTLSSDDLDLTRPFAIVVGGVLAVTIQAIAALVVPLNI